MTMDDLLTRTGHLTDLTVDRYLDEDLADVERASVEAHLEACDPCVELVAEVRAFGDAMNVTIPQLEAAPRPAEPARVLPFRRSGFTVGVSAAFALAAATLVAVALPTIERGGGLLPPDTITLKGPAFAWEVHVHDGQRSRVVEPGERVKAGHRVGFRVQSKRPGHLAIFGADDHGETYVAFPQDDRGRAARWPASETLVDVDAAMAFDANPGRERLVVVFCSEPFELAPTLAMLRDGEAPPDARCTTKDLVLHKGP